MIEIPHICIMKHFAPLLFVVFLSCSGTGKKDPLGLRMELLPCVEELFFFEGSGDFGEVSLGNPHHEVVESRMGISLFASDTEHIDSIPLCHNGKAYVELSCRFLQGKLTEMDAAFYLNTMEEADALMPYLKNALTLKYGPAMEDRGYTGWTQDTASGQKLIFLSDMSVGYNKPALMLTFSSGEGFAV